jgi:class 3 adenylate cyclase
LGDLTNQSSPIAALAAIFDLAGFTNFCKQIDPQLVVPDFLNSFLKWLFRQIKETTIAETYPEGYSILYDLPIYAKFLGDGVLFIWDTKNMEANEICNVIVSLREICENYSTTFLKQISDKYASPPNRVRCGIARGIVYSVGEDNDFVGPCINMAARLQKLGSFTFCFSRRGIDYKENMHSQWINDFLTIRSEIRGIGSDELICVLKSEYDRLNETEKKIFNQLKK